MTVRFLRPVLGASALLMLSACGRNAPDAGVPVNGPAQLRPSVMINAARALESAGTLSLPVTLSGPSIETVTVRFATQDGSALAGSDYQAASGTLTIPAGETRAFVRITLNNDAATEGNETLVVRIDSPVNATLGTPAMATGTIDDDDTPIALSVGAAQVSEGQFGDARLLSFPLRLNRSSTQEVSATFASVDGTATAGSDYTASSGRIRFAPGEVEQRIAIAVTADEAVEPDETLQLRLSDAVGASLQAANGDGVIQNDDALRRFSADDAAASENAGPMVFTVRLSQASGQARTVSYATVPGTAAEGSDYTAASGTLRFASGQTTATVSVALIDDAVVEPTETVLLRLSAEDDTGIADGEGSGSLLDNDTAPGPGPEPTPAANMDLQVLQDIASFDRCDFLNREYCLFPWPNDWFTTADARSTTGRRVNLNVLSMPRNTLGKPLDPSEWNRSDGFSPGQLILARVPGLDLAATGAVPLTNIADSLRDDQAVLVLDLGPAGGFNPTAIPERHLIWAELDANLSKFTVCDGVRIAEAGFGLATSGGVPGAAQLNAAAKALRAQCVANPTPEDPSVDPGPALTIRPAINFTPGHRYVVALRNLKNAAGSTLAAPAAFRIYRDRAPSRLPMVEARRAHFEELFSALGRAGVDRQSLYLAWDFTVISDDNLTGRLVHVRDDALAKLGDRTPGDGIAQGGAPVISNITVVNNTGTGNIAREVRGVITVPSYMDRPFGNAGSRFYYQPGTAGLYGDDLPDINPFTATQQFDFLCRIPRRAFNGANDPATATTGAAQRPALYGHGLLGSKSEGGGQIGSIIEDVGMVYCATDWIGMASHDFDPAQGPIDPVYRDPPFGDILNVATLLTDMSNFATLTDRLQQSFINFTYLGRALLSAEGFCAHAAFRVGDTCLIDRSNLYYDGNSQGGIFGGTLTAISPDIKAATLGVPGMNYSTLLQRSVDFDTYAAFLYASYRASLDQQFVLSLIQMLWDRADNNGYAHHLRFGNPLPNTPDAKRVLLHPAFGDHQVSMTTAEVMARTIGAALKCPAVVAGSSAQRGPAVQAGAHPAVAAEAIALPTLSFNRRHPDDEPYYGIPCINAYPHGGNALVVWDSGPTVRNDGTPRNDNNGGPSGVAPPPVDNRPPRPDLGYGGDPHEFPRSTTASRQMKDAFYRPGGGVVDTCGGRPCTTRGFDPTP